MTGWTNTGDIITNNEPHTFNIYAKDYTPGTVSLGGNDGGNDGMYMVFIKATETGDNPTYAVNGLATVELKSTTTSGLTTVTATSDGLTQGTVNVTTGSGGKEKVVANANPTSIDADGASVSTITAGICDAGNTVITTATDTITFSISGEGTLVGTTAKAAVDGEATVELKSTSTPGTPVVTATASGLTQDIVSVVTNEPSVATSIITTAVPSSLVANGSGTSLITATINDQFSNPMTEAANQITFSHAGEGELVGTTVKNASGGVATVHLKSTVSGAATITATSISLIEDNVVVTLTPGPASKVNLTAQPMSILNDGISVSTVTAKLFDINNNLVETAAEMVTFTLDVITYATVLGGESTPTLNITSIWVQSGGAYVTAQLVVGNLYYIDRTYTLGTIPAAYEGLDWIKTGNGDKQNTANPFLTFNIDVDATVWVGLDNRIAVPSWMGTWTNTGDIIVNAGSEIVNYALYSKHYTAGAVSLGGNEETQPENSMYIVLAKPDEGQSPDQAEVQASGGIATVCLQSTTSEGTTTVTATCQEGALDQGTIQIITSATEPIAEKVLVTANPTSIVADATATSLITASIADSADQTVATSIADITFTVSGEGSLVGTTVKATVSGVITIALQSTLTTGTATVTATADTLTLGTVGVETTPIPNTPPQVTGITASQTAGTGNIVIGYDLSDSEQSAIDIEIRYYNGSSIQACTTLTGDEGTGVTIGSSKTVTWNAKTDFNGRYRSDVYIQIHADDGEVGGTVDGDSATLTLDTKEPEISLGVEMQTMPVSGSGGFTLRAVWNEDSPATPEFDYNLNGTGYTGLTAGTAGNNSTRTYGMSIDGDDRFIGMKCSYEDAYGNTEVDEALGVVWVKPLVPGTPVISGEAITTLDVAISPNGSESGNVMYAIKAVSAGEQFVQSNGALGGTAVWQNAGTWGTPVTVNGLSAATTYYFSMAAGNPNDGNPTEVENSASGYGPSQAGITLPTLNEPPVLANTSASQQAGTGNVMIGYDVSDAEQGSVTISVEYWNGSQYQDCVNTTGDSGAGIPVGTGNSVTWDAKTYYNNQYKNDIRIRVTANDLVGGIESEESSIFTLDTKVPVIATNVEIQPLPVSGNGTLTLHAIWTEDSPGTPQFDYKLNGGAYHGAVAGSAGNDSTRVFSVSLDGDDTITAIKSSYTDSYGNTAVDDENTTEVYVKPLAPEAPGVNNASQTSLAVTINANSGETGAVWYVIKATSTGNEQYAQADGTLNTNPVWQTAAVWGDPVTVSGLDTGTEYYFSLSAGNPNDSNPAEVENSASAYGNSASGTPAAVTVNPPTNLTVTSYGRHEIRLTWQGGTANDRYAIEKSTDGNNFVEIVSWDDNLRNTVYTDLVLTVGTQYWYRVYGCDEYRNTSVYIGLTQTTVEEVIVNLETGGLVEEDNVKIDVSSGTFTDDSYIDIETSPASDEIDAADEKVKIGNLDGSITELNAFSSEGDKLGESDFKLGVLIKIYYDTLDISKLIEESLQIYVLDEGNSRWNKVGGEVNTSGQYVSATVEHFSVYCLMGESSEGGIEIHNAMNYPNPFNNNTVFSFEITKAATVKLDIYTISGRLVKSFGEVELEAGYNEIPDGNTWDGTDNGGEELASGVYIWKISATSESISIDKTNRMVILK